MTYNHNCYIDTCNTLHLNGEVFAQVVKDHETGEQLVYLYGWDREGGFGLQGEPLFDAQNMVNQPNAAELIVERVKEITENS